MPLTAIKKLPRVPLWGLRALASRFRVLMQFAELARSGSQRFAIRWKDRWLCFGDATTSTSFDRHYVFHTAWAARILAETRPAEHIDISSSLYFVSSASAFVPIRFYDYRPARLGLSGLTTGAADLMRLPFESKSIQSLSCMHVIEHVGLGRYGDPLDYDGDLKAASELTRVTANGGQLLIVVPLGREPMIQFNAHRIYTHKQIVQMFKELTLVEFSLIPDDDPSKGLIRHASTDLLATQHYACGCFLFRRISG